MSYVAWESNPGEAIQQVAIFCRHLLKGGATFDSVSQPPYEEVEIYISNNYSKMVGMLARYAISATQTDANVIRVLQSFLVACSVVDVERSQAGAGFGKVPNARFQSFMDQCNSFETYLEKGNLQALAGITFDVTLTAGPEWTGTSKARKALLAQETDSVQPDITRDMMKNSLATNNEDTDF